MAELIDRSGREEVALYALADFPPPDIQDLKALCVLNKLRHAKTPEELLESLPNMKSVDQGAIFREINKGAYNFSDEVCRNRPRRRVIEDNSWRHHHTGELMQL